MVYDPEQMDPDASRSVCWFLITLSKLGVDVFDYDGTMTVLGGLSVNDAEVKTNGLLQVLYNPIGFAFEDPNLHNPLVWNNSVAYRQLDERGTV